MNRGAGHLSSALKNQIVTISNSILERNGNSLFQIRKGFTPPLREPVGRPDREKEGPSVLLRGEGKFALHCFRPWVGGAAGREEGYYPSIRSEKDKIQTGILTQTDLKTT